MTTSYLVPHDFSVTVLKMSIKAGLFVFLTFCCIITPISGIIDNYCITENKKGKNKNKLRTTFPKNHEKFKNSKPRVQLYWFLYKKECIH